MRAYFNNRIGYNQNKYSQLGKVPKNLFVFVCLFVDKSMHNDNLFVNYQIKIQNNIEQ